MSLFYKNVTDHETVLQLDPKLSESVVLACDLSPVILYMLLSSLLLALSMRSYEIIMKLHCFMYMYMCMKFKYRDDICLYVVLYIHVHINFIKDFILTHYFFLRWKDLLY